MEYTLRHGTFYTSKLCPLSCPPSCPLSCPPSCPLLNYLTLQGGKPSFKVGGRSIVFPCIQVVIHNSWKFMSILIILFLNLQCCLCDPYSWCLAHIGPHCCSVEWRHYNELLCHPPLMHSNIWQLAHWAKVHNIYF